MTDYRLTIKPSAHKELAVLSTPLFTRLQVQIGKLATDPRPPGCAKLKGHEDIWRIRIGDYRVLYTIDDEQRIIHISRVAHRREVYD